MQTVCGAALRWQLLAKWMRLEKLTVPQLAKVLTVCHLTQKFITAFTGIRHLFLFWARLIQSTLSRSIPALLCPLLQQQTTLTQPQNVLLLSRSGSAGRSASRPLYRGCPESTDRSHAHSLLQRRKQCFSSFAGKFLSNQHVVQIWPQVIFPVAHRWRNIGWQTIQTGWRSEGWRQGVVERTGGGGLWRRHTKTSDRLWQVSECWWWLRGKITEGL